MKNCKFCKQPIDAEATVCNHCRKTQRQSPIVAGCLVFVVFVIVFFVVIAVIS